METRRHREDDVGMRTDRQSRLILVFVGGAVAILAAVAVFLAVRPPPDFDPATPEGATQGYVRAVLDEDAELVRSYLSVELARKCRLGEIRHFGPDRARVVIVDTEVGSDRAEVDIRITETWGEGPFGSDSYTFSESLVMERQGDHWLIVRPPWPIEHACT